ncbi:hypothetical protein ACFLSJ_08550, partial [Verrucomicrobiota bacterium]
MRTMSRNDSRRDGAALFTVLFVIFTVCALLATMATVSVQRAHAARLLADRIKAQAYAEAGASRAYSVLVTNFAARNNASEFPFTAYGDGSYHASVLPVSNNLAVICSTGVCRSASVSVILDVRDYGGGGSAGWSIDTNLFKFAMLCGGVLDFGGCGALSSSNGTVKLHSNSIMDIRGDAQVNVSVQSSTRVRVSNNVTVDGD